MKHLLILGRPGIGKTTLIRRLTRLVERSLADGFFTEDLREHGQRVGFWLSPLDGRELLLAHRRMERGPSIGPYRVNVDVLDSVAVPVIERGIQHASVLFIDELGRMECCSRAFVQAVQHAFDCGPSIVATAGVESLPAIDKIKRRKDVELVPLSESNREMIARELAQRIGLLCAQDDATRALQRMADRICEMIISNDAAPIDIEIHEAALRDALARAFPGRESLYRLLYENRFRRLWQQFRQG